MIAGQHAGSSWTPAEVVRLSRTLIVALAGREISVSAGSHAELIVNLARERGMDILFVKPDGNFSLEFEE